MTPYDIKMGQIINPWGAEVYWENKKIYMNFLLFLNTEMAWVVEILPNGMQGPVSTG